MIIGIMSTLSPFWRHDQAITNLQISQYVRQVTGWFLSPIFPLGTMSIFNVELDNLDIFLKLQDSSKSLQFL